mmetsp:Transcript_1300/g.3828  ORF Transcript_1300/g.3828 Transcript_1300/m.3828 type:complete len:269 (+) Transcript_1300:1211-2017(+)
MDFTDLMKRFGVDVAAGTLAGAAVTPVISAVDRALAENASGKAQLWESFFGSLREYGSRPIQYLRGPQFAYIWLIYGGTYIAANGVETFCAAGKMDPALPKWVATSTTNTVTCIVKDRAFAQMFGSSVPTNVPLTAYAAWLSRDFVSMGVFFTAPPIVGKYLAREYMDGDEDRGYYTAQVILPLALQTVTTPLHLLGYEIYNNPKGTLADRVSFLQKDYFKNVSIRMVRMAPPWSLGTIGNRELRSGLLSALGLRPLVTSQPVYHVSG